MKPANFIEQTSALIDKAVADSKPKALACKLAFGAGMRSAELTLYLVKASFKTPDCFNLGLQTVQ